ncbi:MAG TPA: hypothetical protein VHT24_08770, partial [Pseudacidobacterium sp.]|nr:hypothetical protein [Pseudacidobacterium sp.]
MKHPIIKACSLLIFVSVFSCVSVYATAFIVIKVPGGYVIAADSLRRYYNGSTESVCKIRTSGNLALIVWGGAGHSDPALDLRSISQQFLDNPQGSPSEHARKLL